MTSVITASSVRLTRIELRRNAMMWMLPVAAALFWYQAYRRTMVLPPLWNLRDMTLQNDAPLDFAMPVAGAAAWTGWREHRRQMNEMLAGTARNRLSRQLAAWAATTAWAVAGYLVCIGVVYALTARQATSGGPLWWPLLVGTSSILALSALGFAAGALLPSRFTAPLVVIVAFFGLGFSSSAAPSSGHSVMLLSPIIAGAPGLGSDPSVAIFYPYLPDLSIVQVMFALGLTVALLGALGLHRRAGGARLRTGAALVTAAGLAAVITAGALANTATPGHHGMIVIPAVHDAAYDQPLRYTPACAETTVQVCVNPAYRNYLPSITGALDPLLTPVAGLPGVPRRLIQVAPIYLQTPQGTTLATPRSSSQFALPGLPGVPGQTGTPAQFADQLRATVALAVLQSALGLPTSGSASPAQQAVFGAITGIDQSRARILGIRPDLLPAPGSPAASAAQRFAGLGSAAQHDWLARHNGALRDGLVGLSELP